MRILVKKKLLESMINLAKGRHPNESILLLRGTINDDDIQIEELILPPYSGGGKMFSQFPLYMLPIDFSIVGSAHSHPSGNFRPSSVDLNKFYSRVMIIMPYPYKIKQVSAFNAKGKKIPIIIFS